MKLGIHRGPPRVVRHSAVPEDVNKKITDGINKLLRDRAELGYDTSADFIKGTVQAANYIRRELSR